ncbi:lipocalin [Alteromonas sediminis]|uniref:Outer membrane lipoprotein Blc n=1 Tax=Alteromonas sediminis TaxID=2259342 RepID=A0A3N5YK74_9ALTE|nr:lipocalin family protein [Alteromonas sediminis]RPJ65231.1 lipocalin [Alteromonas sediminis]
MKKIAGSFGLIFLLVLTASCTSVPEGITPVDDFQVNRYLGKWYEIARFDHSFERGMSNVTATYTLREDGGLDVLNEGFIDSKGLWESADGKAYFVGDQSRGHLKVSFFGPFYASYVVFELDKNNYSYSLVTGPDRSYLWILARDPNVNEATYRELVKKAEEEGFDVSKLIRVAHSA